VNGFKAHELSTANTFSGPSFLATPCNSSFGIQVPANYATAWQNITFSNIEAVPGCTAIQDGIGTSYLRCGSQGLINSQYFQLAISFRVPVRVNVTSVLLRYGAVQTSTYPPPIPLNVETDSPSHVPSGIVLGNGTLQNNIRPGWNEVQIRTSGGASVTLQPRTTYWLVMNGSTIPRANTGYYQWYYVSDCGGSYDDKCVAVMPTRTWLLEKSLFPPINLLSVLFGRAVDDSLKAMLYSSPAEVGMVLNGAEARSNTMCVNASETSFQFTTNCSVTFTANWTARFEHSRSNAVPTHYIAYADHTFWNANFTSDDKPNSTTYPYTWFNRTFKISPIQGYWSLTSPPVNITNTRGYPSSFAAGVMCYLITQTNDVNGSQPWSNDWVIDTRSSFWISAVALSQVVAGLPLTVSVSTVPLSFCPSHCNVTFYNEATGHAVHSRIHAIQSSPYEFQIRLNQSARYKVFLFDKWDDGNEVSLNSTLIVTALAPLCNLTVSSHSSPVIGDPASFNFRFYNNCLGAGNTWMQPEAVYVNGTLISKPSYDPLDGVTTLNVSTESGVWHAGNNHINITAMNGLFSSFIIYPFWITHLNAMLSLNVTNCAVAYGDGIPVGFKLLNTPANKLQALPSKPTLYMNGTPVSFTTVEDGSYVYVLNTRDLPGAGAYYLNFTAEFGPYRGTNACIVEVSKIPMELTMSLDQDSVSPESSLSVTATLAYPNGTAIEDDMRVAFSFTVAYANGTTVVFDELAYTVDGVARFTFQTTADMVSITVQTFYSGSSTQASASTEIQQVAVDTAS
jgi:hypothetical protein